MHVLGHEFGHRRKSSPRRPRDLHIRKISFSGCSLSDGSSAASSTATTPTAPNYAPRSPDQVNPLHLHPAYHAPPRLSERPFIIRSPAPLVVDSDTDEEDLVVVENEIEVYEDPDLVSPTDCTRQEEPSDYFFAIPAPAKRPPMPQSRWSESTVQTLDLDDDEEDEDSDDTASIMDENLTPIVQQQPDETEEDDENDYLEMRKFTRRTSNAALQTLSLNLSYTRPSPVPSRPPMRSLDSVDNFIRRGGWKRRGIVFRAEDMDTRCGDRAFCIST